jgi:NAD(P)-dependent dehydrogenase (short-subunit alcohol dehydrogenase family)
MSENTGKVLVVTGTTSGMGRVIALDAAAAGYTVVATGRDPERMAALAKDAAATGVSLDIHYLDITDHASIAALFRLATDAHGLVGAPFNDAYAASKFALEGAVESLAPAVARYGVKTTIVEPGPVATDVMAPRRFERLLPNERIENSPYPEPWELLSRIIANTGGVQPVEEVGPQILSLLAQDNPPLRFQTAKWATDFVAPKMSGDLDGRNVYTASEAYLALGD